MRLKLAHICFGLSSIFKFFGQKVLKNSYFADTLSIPGVFIINGNLIKLTMKGKINFEEKTWLLPNEIRNEINKLKGN